MANHKSAEKRARQNEIKRVRNKSVRTRVKNVVKAVRLSAENKSEEITAELNGAKSSIDKAAKKGVIHRKTAARKISRLSKLVNSVSAE